MPEFSIEQGDIRSFGSDVVAIKHAQGFFGADRIVTEALSKKGISIEGPPVGECRYLETQGSIQAQHVLCVGVPSMQVLRYQDIQEFAMKVLECLADEAPDTKHLAMTIHGTKDEPWDPVEALRKQFAGYQDAIQRGRLPPALERISVVEKEPARVQLLRQALSPVIAGYTSDSVGPASASVGDLLGIDAEVKVLCAVIAATDVHPPLALGLFGEWGSGKSFFMRMMEKQIRAQSTSGITGFSQNVVQLWFNAWHYSDTDLWASLASEVFEQLSWAVSPDKTVETAAYQREQLLSERASAQARKDQAERQKSEAEAELRRREEQLAKLASCQAVDATTIGKAFAAGVLGEIFTEPTVKAELAETERRVNQTFEEAAQALNYPSVAALQADVLAQKRTLRGWGQVRTLLRLAWNSRNAQAFLWLACGIVVAFILGLLLWAYRHEVEGVAVGLATVLLALATAFAPAIGMAQKMLRVAGRAQEQINSILDKEQTNLDDTVQAAKKNVKAAEELAGEAKTALDDAEREVRHIQGKLGNLRADRQMVEFIEARHRSTDYTRRRGSIGKARDDFEKLAAFLEQVKKEPPLTGDKTGQTGATHPIA